MRASALLLMLLSQPPASSCGIADEPAFGTTLTTAVQVGGGAMYAASRERRYLDALRGSLKIACPDGRAGRRPAHLTRFQEVGTAMRIGGGGLTIKGELTAAEDLTIDGTFEGSIDLPGHRLTVAHGATVNGAVTADAVTVDGRFDGHLSAAHIEITPTAVVEASVVSEHLSLKEGAKFTGAVNTERARAAAEVAKHKRSKA